MMDAGLVELLRCPRTGQALVLDRDASHLRALNEQVADGRLGLASGESLGAPLEAVLQSADQAVRYPVAAGVAYLLAESALVVPTVPRSTGTVSDAEVQRQQMAKYSEVYEDWTGGEDGVTRAIQKVLHRRYGQLLAGATVLDVGNGGTPAQAQYGAEIAQTLKHFIAADKSPHMLSRSGPFGDLVLADAFGLPFKDAAVDFVTVNNTIHHFGRRRGQAPLEKMRGFFDEALRVAQRGVVGVELLVPAVGEVAEKMLLGATGFMPTFVYSAGFYEKIFRELGLRVTDFQVMTLNQLTSPWKVIPPVLDFTWLRVPTFMVPYSFLFFSIEK